MDFNEIEKQITLTQAALYQLGEQLKSLLILRQAMQAVAPKSEQSPPEPVAD